jgi:hypothetical protein
VAIPSITPKLIFLTSPAGWWMPTIPVPADTVAEVQPENLADEGAASFKRKKE